MADDDKDAANAVTPAGNGNGNGGGTGGNGNGGQGSGNGGAAAAPAGGGLPEPQSDVLSLAQLIGAPIHALVDAEAQSAMATARFIRAVGFTGPADDDGMGELGELQMARFTRKRRNPDGTEDDVEVQIPLLSMLPIPALQIKDAQLDYTVKIVQTEALPQRQAEINRLISTKRMGPLGEPPATLRAAFAREPRPGDRRSVDMLVKMKLRIEQADMPGGLAQLLALATESSRQDKLEPPKNNGSENKRPGNNRSTNGRKTAKRNGK